MNDYATKNRGTIDSLQIFAHSGPTGIYFDQTSGTNSLYTSKAGIDTYENPGAKEISDINPKLFDGTADVKLWECNALNGDNSFGRQLGEHIGNNVTGATSGTQFSANPNGPAGAGLPNPVPNDYAGDIYLVPDN